MRLTEMSGSLLFQIIFCLTQIHRIPIPGWNVSLEDQCLIRSFFSSSCVGLAIVLPLYLILNCCLLTQDISITVLRKPGSARLRWENISEDFAFHPKSAISRQKRLMQECFNHLTIRASLAPAINFGNFWQDPKVYQNI